MIFSTMQDGGILQDQKYSQKYSYNEFNRNTKDSYPEEKSKGHNPQKKEREYGANPLSTNSANERRIGALNYSNEKNRLSSYYDGRAQENSKEQITNKDVGNRVDYNLKLNYQESQYTPKVTELRNAQRKAEEVSRSKENYHQTLENMLNSASSHQNQIKKQQQQEYARRYAETKPQNISRQARESSQGERNSVPRSGYWR